MLNSLAKIRSILRWLLTLSLERKNAEVDLVYDHPDNPIAIEVTTGSGHTLTGLHMFSDRYQKFSKRCFLIAPNLKPRMPLRESFDEIGHFPLDAFLLCVSMQAEKE